MARYLSAPWVFIAVHAARVVTLKGGIQNVGASGTSGFDDVGRVVGVEPLELTRVDDELDEDEDFEEEQEEDE